MMSDDEMRLRCLELALQSETGLETMDVARKFYEFVSGKSVDPMERNVETLQGGSVIRYPLIPAGAGCGYGDIAGGRG